MRKLKGQAECVRAPRGEGLAASPLCSGPSAEGFTLSSVLAAFAALGEAFEAAAEVRQGKERLALIGGAPDRAARHGGASEAYNHAAQQLLDLVASLEYEDAPWETTLSRADEARA